MDTLRVIQTYYLGSPLFFLVSLWWGVELRTTFLPDLRLRFLYYLLLGALGLLTWFRPATAPWVALGESSLNVFLLAAGIVLPIYDLAGAATGGQPLALPYSAGEVLVNGLLAGSFFIVGFYRAQAEILRGWARGGGGRRKRG